MKLRLLRCKVTNASVDWITCTAATKSAREELWSVGERLLQRRQGEGEDTTAWHANGYSGWSDGSVCLGARPDGCILRLSGQEASHKWRECFAASENCSRLDLAVDCQVDRPVLRLSRQIYHDAGHVAPLRGRKPKRHLIVSGDGGSTVYIGARVSESFGRVYDKGIEQKVCPAGLWWRWELELKGKTAWHHAGLLRSTDDHRVLLMAKVAHWFRARTTHSYTSTVSELCIQNAREATTTSRRLRWLAHDVRPTVQALVERVGLNRVLFALGLPSQSAVDPAVPSTIDKECA